jgi:hypothetical protein
MQREVSEFQVWEAKLEEERKAIAKRRPGTLAY